MKKLERLLYIERVHGPEFVNPYAVCYTKDDMSRAYHDLWLSRAMRKTNIRTDWIKPGRDQGYELPFAAQIDLSQAYAFMDQHGRDLVYLVNMALVKAAINGVAIRLDANHALFEINAKEPGIPQRHMYRSPENLQQFVLGPSGYWIWNGSPMRCYQPSDMWGWSFDVVYRQMFLHGEEELTFSVRDFDRSIILW